jgi:hypothetical protein
MINSPPPGIRSQAAGNIRDQPNDADPMEQAEAYAGGLTEKEALKLARDAWSTATDFTDANYRKDWELGLRYFDGRHDAGSKYYHDRYKHRSKGFRPKSRSWLRKLEAQATAAFFSNPQIASVEASNQDDPAGVATGKMIEALLQYRLEHSIPSFLTIIGGVQDAGKTGIVVSYNYWNYKTRTKTKVVEQPMIDAATGMPAMDMMGQPMTMPIETQVEEVVADKPCIELVPPEYIKFSPNAKWYDPINTSPYLGRIVPMYLSEVRERMDKPDRSGRQWRSHTDQQILAASKKEFDTTRQTRAGKQQDAVTTATEPSAYELVMAIEWIVERSEGDICYWTIGTDLLVSEPYALEDVYLHGKRPLTMGFINLETHRVMPKSPLVMAGSLQRELNELTNDRRDNVRLVLQKQWFVRAGQQIDTSNLMYGIPGGVTHMRTPGGPDPDIVPQEWGDVTPSSYNEQDRLNSDIDELLGNFSAASITSNRRLNETVGGLELLGEGANALSEYSIRTLSETWLLPTLRQLVLLEQYYETDERIMALCGAEKLAKAYKTSMGEMVERMIDEELIVRMRVGMNATDPNRKLLRFVLAMRNLKEMATQPVPGMNMVNVGAEVFSLLGYGDGMRFWNGTEVEQQVLQQAEQMATEVLEQAELAAKDVLEAAQKRLDQAETAESSAQEEQMQLLRAENSLMTRFVAQAFRELKFEAEQKMAKLAAGVEGQNLANERTLFNMEKKQAAKPNGDARK